LIPSIPFSNWWCCLNPKELNSLVFCGTNYLINPTYIGRETFDAAMAFTGLMASSIELAQFMHFYGLQYELIPCGEDCFIDAVVFIDGFWPMFAVFMGTSDFICPEPCKLLTWPE